MCVTQALCHLSTAAAASTTKCKRTSVNVQQNIFVWFYEFSRMNLDVSAAPVTWPFIPASQSQCIQFHCCCSCRHVNSWVAIAACCMLSSYLTQGKKTIATKTEEQNRNKHIYMAFDIGGKQANALIQFIYVSTWMCVCACGTLYICMCTSWMALIY